MNVTDTDASELTEISHQLLSAIRGRDASALDRLLHDEFAQINEAGVRTARDAFMTAIVTTSYEVVSLSFDFLSVDVFGDTAVVCGVQRAVVRLESGEEVTGRSAFTDVFAMHQNRWLLRLATSVELG
jgi:ketosteroid isomerase-like protein